VRLAGDTNSTGEWTQVTIAGNTQRLYTPGSQDNNLNDAVVTNGATPVFNNLDVTSSTFTSGSNLFLRVQASCSSSVGTFATASGNRYDLTLRLNNGAGFTTSADLSDAQLNNSGSDLLLASEEFGSAWGLGQTQPTAAIAFQGRTPGSYTNFAEGFSSLTNQRVNGRYGTLGVKYSQQYSSTNTNGRFAINFFEGTNESYGSGS